MINEFNYLVVGAGFFGSVIAERIADDLNENVLVIDKRNHIGGNCYSETDRETGIEYHKYGTHIFHTSNAKVMDYIKRFTEFNGYYHQVLTMHKDKVYQMPINLETINSFYNINLKPYEVDNFLESGKTIIYENPGNFEELAINMIGRELYEAFIKGYTHKQWDRNPVELPASILKRLPFRKNYNESYFFDKWQGIPLKGYTALFNNMLSNPKIKVLTDTDFFNIRNTIKPEMKIIYTGALDHLFDYKFGKLEWRSLKFEFETKNVSDFQGTSVMNYADYEIPFTRIHEPKHLHIEREAFGIPKTVIVREYSCLNDEEPYYPIQDEKNEKVKRMYIEELKKHPNLYVGGRLGDYRYYDMHNTIEKALDLYEQSIAAGK